MMEDHAGIWKEIRGSRPIPSYGNIEPGEPPAFTVDMSGMVDNFKEGFKNFSSLWGTIINARSFAALGALAENRKDEEFRMTTGQAEGVIEKQAQIFEDFKPYLLEIWS